MKSKARISIRKKLAIQLLYFGPNNPARRESSNAIERTTGGDVKRPLIIPAERAVGNLVARHRQEGEQLPVGTQDINAPLLLHVRLKRWVRLVQPGSNEQPAL